MAKIIHTMIRVADEDRSTRFYKQAFDLDVADRFPFDGFTLVYLRNDECDIELELTINEGQEDAYSHGSGYGHIAVAVDDIEAEHARFEELGFDPTPVKSMDHNGNPLATFFFVTDPDGYKIEILKRQGRYR
ncbi:VOC family protein [Paraurantiacibacter namhicola]|uniref:Aldoketomutase n=1 Tax=Paraurantiacibacter namhicola TaxID=645517 RepID=A0A1C7DAC3_9SPHN|nr:VOC family protein [Paraurantiacibacter namhicola]ANU08440.1 Lactoylglutathione lyase [Paraurantiacibacter namhicola]